ncbi:MAG: GNAT family N-acetyltransferase [Rhodobacteraceae bacterium]|nr:GNAT family N-acetyltransferase [Paracoccaceae bacterium]
MLRPARPSDEDGVRICAQEAYAQYEAAIGRKPAPMAADFGQQIANGVVHVAEDSAGEVAGFAVFFRHGDHMFLENIAVRQAVLGTGLGRRLIERCEAEARAMGLRKITLYTNEKMLTNLTLYPHLGFEETDRRTEDGFSRVYFEKRLS